MAAASRVSVESNRRHKKRAVGGECECRSVLQPRAATRHLRAGGLRMRRAFGDELRRQTAAGGVGAWRSLKAAAWAPLCCFFPLMRLHSYPIPPANLAATSAAAAARHVARWRGALHLVRTRHGQVGARARVQGWLDGVETMFDANTEPRYFNSPSSYVAAAAVSALFAGVTAVLARTRK